MACAYLDLDCKVYMVKCSYEQKPFRREVMRTYGASVTPSPSDTTEVGRKILAEHPGTTGSQEVWDVRFLRLWKWQPIQKDTDMFLAVS